MQCMMITGPDPWTRKKGLWRPLHGGSTWFSYLWWTGNRVFGICNVSKLSEMWCIDISIWYAYLKSSAMLTCLLELSLLKYRVARTLKFHTHGRLTRQVNYLIYRVNGLKILLPLNLLHRGSTTLIKSKHAFLECSKFHDRFPKTVFREKVHWKWNKSIEVPILDWFLFPPSAVDTGSDSSSQTLLVNHFSWKHDAMSGVSIFEMHLNQVRWFWTAGQAFGFQ